MCVWNAFVLGDGPLTISYTDTASKVPRDVLSPCADSDARSQGAVLSMTRELAMIHAREGIRFNSICP